MLTGYAGVVEALMLLARLASHPTHLRAVPFSSRTVSIVCCPPAPTHLAGDASFVAAMEDKL